jgi:hypothetical protein
MGWLDKLKVKLGVLDADEADNLEEEAPRAERRLKRPERGERPSLDGIEPASQQSLEDVLAAREAGDRVEMRRLLRELDRGRGLRLVLRAAAALEAGDEAELAELLPKLHGEEYAWRLPLQLASVLEDAARADALRARAASADAPRWALSWSRALAADPEEQRRGLVELLAVDPALARTVAARDLGVEGALADPEGADRYAAFAHGRQCIRRFGATTVADVLDRAGGRS